VPPRWLRWDGAFPNRGVTLRTEKFNGSFTKIDLRMPGDDLMRDIQGIAFAGLSNAVAR
jgi:hypothetical protein